MEKISAVYKITNIETNDCYVGSSKDINRRWKEHKRPSIWNSQPNNKLYNDMKKYGLDNFQFQILKAVEPEHLREIEQQYIEMLQPTYNNINAKGLDIERQIETDRKYEQTEKRKKLKRKAWKKYYNRLCFYNGEELTLGALKIRFSKAGIEHPTLEAKKYLLNQ